MAIYKNKSGQKLAVFAYDTSAGAPKTGDAAAITAEISLSGAASAATNDANPTELDATDHPGIYIFDLTQAETNADLIVVSPVSSTSDILIEPQVIYTQPERREADVMFWYGSAIPGVDANGVPTVSLTYINGEAQPVIDLQDFADTGYDPSTHKVQGVVSVDTCTENTDMVAAAPTVAAIRAEIDSNSTQLAAIVADTNELQTNQGNWLTATGFAVAGDPMNLADDAITAAKFDKSTAFPVTSADTGSTAIARTGADGDTLETLSDEIAVNLAAIAAINVTSGAGIPYAPTGDNTGGAIEGVSFVGVQTSGTYASTEAADGVYHQIDDTGDAIDIVYQFDVEGTRNGVDVVWRGYLSGSNDAITVQAYDHVGSDWETLRTISGTASTSNQTENIPLLTKHTGSDANDGRVLIRFVCTGQSNPTLYTDQLLVEAVLSEQFGTYVDGIHVDTNAGNENTTVGVDGTDRNPVSTWAAALTLSTATNINTFRIAGGSSITLTADSSNYEIYGKAYDIDLNGQTITNASINGGRVTGTGVVSGTAAVFEYCGMGAVTLGPSRLYQCGIGRASGTFAAGSAGQFILVDCFSLVPGSGTPVLNFSGTGSTTGVNIRGWKGGSNTTMDSDCTLSLEVLAGGGQTVVTGGGNAEIRGLCRSVNVTVSASETVQVIATTGPITITDNASVAPTINLYGIASSVTDGTGLANDYTQTRTNWLGGNYALNTTSNGNIGIDWANVENATTTLDLANTSIKDVDTVNNAVTVGTNNDKTGYFLNGTITTLDDLDTALDSAHGAGSWATATGFSTFNASTDTVTLANGAHGGAAASITLADYSDFQGGAGSAPTVEEIRAEMDSNSTQLAAIVEDTGTTIPATLATLATEIGDIEGGDTTVYVQPVQSTIQSDGGVKKNVLYADQYASFGPWSVVVTDANDDEIDLTGRTIKWVMYSSASAGTILESTVPSIAGSTFTVSFTPSNVTRTGVYLWKLYDTEALTVLAAGRVKIFSGPDPS